MGFDGVEILHQQMKGEDNSYLQELKRRAFTQGLDLMGFSTHQGFVSPDKQVRQKNIDHTLRCIDLAYRLGIPTLRVNTGRWNTIKSFDDLMKARGIEPILPGVTEDDGFKWCIESIEKCLPKAQQCGVTMCAVGQAQTSKCADGGLQPRQFTEATREAGRCLALID